VVSFEEALAQLPFKRGGDELANSAKKLIISCLSKELSPQSTITAPMPRSQKMAFHENFVVGQQLCGFTAAYCLAD
jgi:hypothetical protein